MYLALRDAKTGAWSIDGCHEPDSDMTLTYQIFMRHFPKDMILRITIDEAGFPRVEDITEEARAAVDKPSRLNPEFDSIVDGYQRRKNAAQP